MNNAIFVIAKNKFDHREYIGTFKYVQKSSRIPRFNLSITTKLEVAVVLKNTYQPELNKGIGSPKVYMLFDNFGNMTREEIDSFISNLIANENLEDIESGKNFAGTNKDNQYVRYAIKALNLSIFKKTDTIVYSRIDDEITKQRNYLE